MTVKVVTDSCSDILPETANYYNITFVRVNVRFRTDVAREGIGINHESVWKLVSTPQSHLATAWASPGDFLKVYDILAGEADEIVSIHVTLCHGVAYGSAVLGGQELINSGYPTKHFDSRGISGWQGMVGVAATRAFLAGESLVRVVYAAEQTVSKLTTPVVLGTTRFAVRGGRLGKVAASVDSVFQIKPFIALRDGQVIVSGVTRTRIMEIDGVFGRVYQSKQARRMVLIHSAQPLEIEELQSRIRITVPEAELTVVCMGA